MFKCINTLAANFVGRFLIDDNFLYLKNNSTLTKLDISNGQIIKSLNVGEEIDSIINAGNEIIVYFSSKSKRLTKVPFSLINDKEYELLHPYHQPPYNNLQLILVGDDVLERNCGLFNLQTKEILWVNGRIFNPIILTGCLLSDSVSKIERFDLLTGELLWSQLVSEIGRHYLKFDKRWEKGEVDKFLGIYKMVLWVLLKNGLIIGLDIETGKIVHEIKEPVEYPLAYTLFDKELNNFYGKPCMLDSVKGKIIGIAQSGIAGSFPSYYEIDLDIPIVQLKIMQRPNDDFQGFHADGGAIGYAWPFDNDYIYLCNYRDYKLALFNRMAKQIDWVHQMEVDPAKKTFIIKMEVHGNRWYVLDNSKTLYVYEREA